MYRNLLNERIYFIGVPGFGFQILDVCNNAKKLLCIPQTYQRLLSKKIAAAAPNYIAALVQCI
jgi:hypothetical protein